MEHKLEIDVHAHWNDIPPVYRLYIDDELFTERTFWQTPYQFYLTEHIFCNLDTGVHTFKIENLNSDSRFELDNFRVNSNVVNKNLMKSNGSKIEWKFIVDLMNANSHANHVIPTADNVSRPVPMDTKPVQPAAPVPHKKYETNLALVQRMRELNNRAAKK